MCLAFGSLMEGVSAHEIPPLGSGNTGLVARVAKDPIPSCLCEALICFYLEVLTRAPEHPRLGEGEMLS